MVTIYKKDYVKRKETFLGGRCITWLPFGFDFFMSKGNQSNHGHLFLGRGGFTWLPFVKKTM